MTATAAIIAIVIIGFLNFLLKKKIIESGKLDENYLELLNKRTDNINMLKWGILFLSGGIGLVVLGFLPYYADQSPIPWGIEAIFLSAGFLIYYLIVRNTKI